MGLNTWVILFVLLISFRAQAQTPQEVKQLIANEQVVLVTDFDRTLTGPAWNAVWLLKKVKTLTNALQLFTPTEIGMLSYDQLPAEVAVSENEFMEIYKYKMAVKEKSGAYTLGSRYGVWLPVSRMPGREKPIMFIPGYYAVEDKTNTSFEHFAANSPSFLISDDEVAKANETPKISRFGIAFPLFQALTATPGGPANIHIPTARPQPQEEFTEGLFVKWQNEGWIGNIYSQSTDGRLGFPISVYPLGAGEGLYYGNNIVDKKIHLDRGEIIEHYRLNYLQTGKKYLVVFAEDNAEIVKEYHNLLTNLSAIRDYSVAMDFMLVHADPVEANVRRSPLPGRYVIYKNGFAEVAPPNLVKGLFPSGPAQKMITRFPSLFATSSAGSCRGLFVKGL